MSIARDSVTCLLSYNGRFIRVFTIRGPSIPLCILQTKQRGQWRTVEISEQFSPLAKGRPVSLLW